MSLVVHLPILRLQIEDQDNLKIFVFGQKNRWFLVFGHGYMHQVGHYQIYEFFLTFEKVKKLREVPMFQTCFVLVHLISKVAQFFSLDQDHDQPSLIRPR